MNLFSVVDDDDDDSVAIVVVVVARGYMAIKASIHSHCMNNGITLTPVHFPPVTD